MLTLTCYEPTLDKKKFWGVSSSLKSKKMAALASNTRTTDTNLEESSNPYQRSVWGCQDVLGMKRATEMKNNRRMSIGSRAVKWCPQRYTFAQKIHNWGWNISIWLWRSIILIWATRRAKTQESTPSSVKVFAHFDILARRLYSH